MSDFHIGVPGPSAAGPGPTAPSHRPTTPAGEDLWHNSSPGRCWLSVYAPGRRSNLATAPHCRPPSAPPWFHPGRAPVAAGWMATAVARPRAAVPGESLPSATHPDTEPPADDGVRFHAGSHRPAPSAAAESSNQERDLP